MRKNRQIIYTVFVCALFWAKISSAGIPAFDPGTVVSDLKQFNELREDLKSTTEQLKKIKEDLSAMGESLRSVAAQTKVLAKKVTGISETSDNFEKNANNNSDSTNELNDEVIGVVDDMGEAQTGVINNVVDGISSAIIDNDNTPNTNKKELIVNPINKPIVVEQKIDEPVIKTPTLNTPKVEPPALNTTKVKTPTLNTPKVKTPLLKKTEIINEPIVFEEEEEEEEISEKDALKAEFTEYFNEVRLENKKIHTQMNDILDMYINKLNENLALGNSIFEVFENNINEYQKMGEKEKQTLLKRIADIKKKQQDIMERNISIAEDVKSNYNLEYKNKILDGLINYERIVVAYINGDISKEEVIKAGKKLKEDASTLAYAPDKNIMLNLKKELATIKKEVTKITKDIKKREKYRI